MSEGQGKAGPGGRAARKLEEFAARVAARDDVAALDAAAVGALEAFDARGVQALLLKGPALARLLYEPGERRAYVDVDLLVAPGDLAQAREVLEELGYRNATAALGIEDVGGVVHEEGWVGPSPTGGHEVVIELHWRLAGALAPPQTAWDALAARRTSIELGARRVPVLNPDGLAMQLATHAAQHGRGYAKGLKELELGIERWPREVWQRAAVLAEEIGATEAFAAGLRLVPEGEELAGVLDLPATDRLDWEIRHLDARPRGTFHLGALTEARGFRARWRVIRHALLPSREWIVWQYPRARAGGARLVFAYILHLTRTPAWALRAWRFRRRARREA